MLCFLLSPSLDLLLTTPFTDPGAARLSDRWGQRLPVPHVTRLAWTGLVLFSRRNLAGSWFGRVRRGEREPGRSSRVTDFPHRRRAAANPARGRGNKPPWGQGHAPCSLAGLLHHPRHFRPSLVLANGRATTLGAPGSSRPVSLTPLGALTTGGVHADYSLRGFEEPLISEYSPLLVSFFCFFSSFCMPVRCYCGL
jgi:hypothetical protein